MKEGLENLRRALGEKTADRKDIQQQIISSTTTIQGKTRIKWGASSQYCSMRNSGQKTIGKTQSSLFY